ncbi:pyruvate decarboxylase [Lasiosphaeris hirsuta]|uniref:Pyruvate decarboxylase n=1 Tax=Lasiosphaeris hirsuta TaxID=260670 RepID=A0AA40E1S2_9PEZI|nr:pyruvate decarboxylase [Lasiosphaeris hirsuta]
MDIRTHGLNNPTTVAEYLFTRLHQVGIRSVHGLPSDFNLVALDYLPKNMVAYAADSYAQTKGIGALLTTFGVGELSAINGVAGAYSEHIPVVHMVGCPSTISQRNGMLLHHTLGNGDFNAFANMSSQISCYVAKLNKPAEIADQIDHALHECWICSRPIYIMLPTDVVEKMVEGQRLKTPIDLSEPPSDPEREDYVVDVVLKYPHAAKNPVILVDACAVRHQVLNEVNELVEKTKLPVFVTPMGKGADLVLSIGALKSDFNTTGFSYRTSQLNTIDFHSTHCTVHYSEYPGFTMRGVLRKVADRVDRFKLSPMPMAKVQNELTRNCDSSSTIIQACFWTRISEYVKEGDIVVTETGTPSFGIWETKFPTGVTNVTQILWGSIGWSVGAAQGAALGAHDAGKDRRTILLVVDGSFQLTVQEVSTMVRMAWLEDYVVGCSSSTLFLRPNVTRADTFAVSLSTTTGFTIERCIHGMTAEYNDIARWKYTDIPAVFGGTDKQVKRIVIKTKEELEVLFRDKFFNDAEGLQFVELWMPKDDAPRALKLTAEIAARNNTKLE